MARRTGTLVPGFLSDSKPISAWPSTSFRERSDVSRSRLIDIDGPDRREISYGTVSAGMLRTAMLDGFFVIESWQTDSRNLLVRLVPDHFEDGLVDPVVTIAVTELQDPVECE